jgi:hypothetical protein
MSMERLCFASSLCPSFFPFVFTPDPSDSWFRLCSFWSSSPAGFGCRAQVVALQFSPPLAVHSTLIPRIKFDIVSLQLHWEFSLLHWSRTRHSAS